VNEHTQTHYTDAIDEAIAASWTDKMIKIDDPAVLSRPFIPVTEPEEPSIVENVRNAVTALAFASGERIIPRELHINPGVTRTEAIEALCAEYGVELVYDTRTRKGEALLIDLEKILRDVGFSDEAIRRIAGNSE
jgi:hypothetical protein